MSAAPFSKEAKVSFLAPMQDISDRGFMRIVDSFGRPDFFIAEYFRIHEFFEFEPHILDSILWSSDRVCAQFIGESETHIARAISVLKKYSGVKMLDLNLGCPAPKIYRKNVGGGLLRSPEKIRSILNVMRGEWEGCLSVKMRTGFEASDNFDEIFSAVLDGHPDFVTIHARTVKQLYRGVPDYSKIARAVKMCDIPVVANGDILSAKRALEVFDSTGCAGVMVGRHAVRNPWIFRQISDILAGRKIFAPTLADVREYIENLRRNIEDSCGRMKYIDSRLKKFLNFVGAGVDAEGDFLYKMRRARGIDALMNVCDEFLIENGNADKLFAVEPYEGLCSRPNHEGEA